MLKMSFQSDLDELNNLNLEIKRLMNSIKDYRKQKNVIEKRIIEYLKSQGTGGVKYNNQAILLETKNTRSKVKKNEKTDNILIVLKKHNVNVSENVVKEIIDAQKGKEVKNDKLKIVKNNSNNLLNL